MDDVNKKIEESYGYYLLEMYDDALVILDRILDWQPEFLTALKIKAEVLREAEKYSDAISVYRHLLTLNREEEGFYIGLGWCYKRTGQIEKAVHSLENLVALHPESSLAHYNLACYYTLSDRLDQALEYLQRAVAMDFSYKDLARTEKDFDRLRDTQQFQKIVGRSGNNF